ncbi:MAG: hypothetical protein ACRDKS_01190 [Actinomycetota bacterium]
MSEGTEIGNVAAEIKRLAETLPEGRRPTPQQIADHFASTVFTGGPPALFEQVGRESFITLLENGLYPYSTLLDIGCGSLRLGYWLINFLNPACYYGIEPIRSMLEFGLTCFLDPAVAQAKRPAFDYNADFDLTVFGRRFDFLVARSIWTHVGKSQIGTMLDGFAECAADGGVFLASYVPAAVGDGYAREDFVATPLVEHGLEWVGRACAARGLTVRQLPHVINKQPWLRIERATGSIAAGLTRDERPPGARERLRMMVRAARGIAPG